MKDLLQVLQYTFVLLSTDLAFYSYLYQCLHLWACMLFAICLSVCLSPYHISSKYWCPVLVPCSVLKLTFPHRPTLRFPAPNICSIFAWSLSLETGICLSDKLEAVGTNMHLPPWRSSTMTGISDSLLPTPLPFGEQRQGWVMPTTGSQSLSGTESAEGTCVAMPPCRLPHFPTLLLPLPGINTPLLFKFSSQDLFQGNPTC